MRSGGLLLRVRPALRPAIGRVLLAGLVITLLAPASTAGAQRTTPLGGARAPEPAAPLPAPPGSTFLISRNRDRTFADYGSKDPAISDNGRWIAFTSTATDLVNGDVNDADEIFLRDRREGKTIRIPLPRGTVPAGGAAYEPAISADGTVVAFTYQGPPVIVPAPGNDGPPTTFTPGTLVLAYDRTTGVTRIVSRDMKDRPAAGAHEPSVSADGRYIAYATNADISFEDEGMDDVFRYDRTKRTTVEISLSPEGRRTGRAAFFPSISGDGNLVAFVSDGGDTIVHENTGSGNQVYVRDVRAELTTRVSAANDGGPANAESGQPAISGNGAFIAYVSTATNLVDGVTAPQGGLYRRDLAARKNILVSVTPTGAAATGFSAQPSITPDGNMIAFASNAPDLAPLTGERIALAATNSRFPAEVYLRDIEAGETVLISVPDPAAGAATVPARSLYPAVAGGGRFVAFASDSQVLVPKDFNEVSDVFLRDMPPVPIVNPPTLDLGAGAVGTESLPGAAVLANAGWAPLTVTGATITGADKGDFLVVADACAGRLLKRGQACTVSVVFKPVAKGARSATLAIADTFNTSPRTVSLRGRASQAKLVLDPEIGPPGIVVMAKGSGFPPGAVLNLRWSRGITPHLRTVTADAKGRFRVPVLVFHNDLTGDRKLIAESATGTGFPPATVRMLVVRPTSIPPTFGIVRIVDLPLVLVIRG